MRLLTQQSDTSPTAGRSLLPANSVPFFLLALMGFGGAAGCVTSAREEALRRSIQTLETKIEQLEQSRREDEQKLHRIGSKASYAENASSELEDLKRQVSLTQGAVDELRVKFSRLAETSGGMPLEADLGEGYSKPGESLQSLEQRIAALESALGTAAPQPTQRQRSNPSYVNVKELTKILGTHFGKKEFKKVSAVAEEVLFSDLSEEHKEIALLFRAEAAFAEENYKSASLDFSNFLKKYEASKRRPRALLLAGDSFVYLKDFDTARSYYQECVDKFPDKQECVAAKERLDRLGS